MPSAAHIRIRQSHAAAVIASAEIIRAEAAKLAAARAEPKPQPEPPAVSPPKEGEPA